MATPRAKLQAIRLTDAAADRIKYVMANALQPIVGVRVGVKNGGCAGMTYTMEYAERIEAADEVVEDKGVRVLIDPKAVLFLIGTEMDYKTEKLSAQFVFNNPNQTSACGCGESVQLKAAARHRCRDVVASRRALAPVLAVAHVAVFTLVVLAVVVLALAGRVLTRVALSVLAPFGALFFRILLRGRVRLFAHPRNGLADQLLDCPDASAVGGRDDGDRGAAASGAPGAADAMHVVVGVMRDVE